MGHIPLPLSQSNPSNCINKDPVFNNAIYPQMISEEKIESQVLPFGKVKIRQLAMIFNFFFSKILVPEHMLAALHLPENK